MAHGNGRRRNPPAAARPQVELRPAAPGRPPLEIHRSPRRRRSAQAYARDGAVVLRLPAGLPLEEEDRLIEGLVRKVSGRARADALGGDAALAARADELADRYLDGIRADTVTWSGRMGRQHGSCTPADGSVRISRDVAVHPTFVLDYVVIHELAHLQVSGHTAAFHALVARYPDAERARGYLEGFAAGRLAAGAPVGDPAQPDGMVDQDQPAGSSPGEPG